MYWGEDWTWGGRALAPRWHLSLVTPPVLDPISVADAKAHARITHDYEDLHVLTWIKAATRMVEHDTEMALLTQVLDVAIEGFPSGAAAFTLPIRPVQSITHVKYYDSLGTLQTMPSGDYLLDPITLALSLDVDASWPSDVRTGQAATVRIQAGHTTADLVPEDLKHAVRLLVGHFFSQREATQASDRPQSIAFGYEALIAPYVRHRAA